MPNPGLRLTEEQMQWLRENAAKMSRAKLAQHLGISQKSTYRLTKAESLPCWLKRPKVPYEEAVAIVREHYADMSGPEIDETFGLSKGRATRIARHLGIKHGEAALLRLKEKRHDGLLRIRALVDCKEAGRRNRILRRMDELRVMSGLPQKTRFRLSMMPRKIYKVKWDLCKRHGYHFCEGEPYTILYDSDTNRLRGYNHNPRSTEEYFAKKYGFVFAEAEDDEPAQQDELTDEREN